MSKSISMVSNYWTTVTLVLPAGTGLLFFAWSSDSSPGQYVFFFCSTPSAPAGILLLSCCCIQSNNKIGKLILHNFKAEIQYICLTKNLCMLTEILPNCSSLSINHSQKHKLITRHYVLLLLLLWLLLHVPYLLFDNKFSKVPAAYTGSKERNVRLAYCELPSCSTSNIIKVPRISYNNLYSF